MGKCLGCHDGERASTECTLCHTEDVSTTVLAEREEMATVRLETNSGDCYACHQQERCTSCHGITMPHPAGWYPGEPKPGGAGAAGTHVKQGFAQRELCYRCHFDSKPFERPQKGCGPKCHKQPYGLHGGVGWVKEHGLQATGQKGGRAADCFFCHAQTLCEDCHDASYTARVNPTGTGLDNYPREMPWPPEQLWAY